ncbi:HdeD family acid-resistance protein [soil metagenome]
MQTLSEYTPLPRLWKSTLATGILSAILGAMVLIWPSASLVVAAAFFGANLVIAGVAQVYFAFGLPLSSAGGRVLMFISGAASLILAVLCFRSLADSILLLAIWIGIGLIFRGVAETVTAITDETIPSRGWVAFAGIITILAGFVMLAYPFTSLGTLLLVAAVWLIVLGIVEIIAAVKLRSETSSLDQLGAAPAAAQSS